MTLLAEVIVELPSWRLDRPLTYSVPEKLAARLKIGSIVRVPLRGRRVRGWVVDVGERESVIDVSDVLGTSGRGPVFDASLLEACRAASRRYIHPLASFLKLLTPARLGRPKADEILERPTHHWTTPTPQLWILGPGEDPFERYEDLIRKTVQRDLAAIVCAPEVREGSALLERLARAFPGDVAMVHSGIEPGQRSSGIWDAIFDRKRVLLGGRGAVLTPARFPGLFIIHSENDRSLKEQRSPYYDAREVAGIRAAISGAQLVMSSATPSLVTISRAREEWSISEPPRAKARGAWPAVELLEPAGSRAEGGGIPRRAIAAIIEARRRGSRSIVFLPRAKATSSGPGPSEVARFVERVVPDAVVSRADREALGEPGELVHALVADVVIATEAALADVERPRVSVAIALGVDGWFKRPQGRSVEDGFATLWSLGALLASEGEPKSNRRLLLETSQPDHYAIQALVRGDYNFFAEREMEVRRDLSSPPFTHLVKMRAKRFSAELVEAIQSLDDVDVFGPVPSEVANGRDEVLIKAADLEAVLDPLRDILISAEAQINVEVDPRDW